MVLTVCDECFPTAGICLPIWTSCRQPLHETIDRRWNFTLCIAHHRAEASQVAFLCNKEVGLSVSAKWWTTDVQVQPGARNQAVDETRITFITLHEHCLGTGTRSAFSVFH